MIVKKKFIDVIVFVLLALAIVASFPFSLKTYAKEIEFDKTNVVDDLLTSHVGNKKFELQDFPADENGKLTLLTFAEYCYSYYANNQSKYNLYLYIFNPAKINIDTATLSNTVQIATSFNAEGEVISYTKQKIVFLSKSSDNLFYKFKLADSSVFLNSFKNASERKYCVSGIELLTKNDLNMTDYPISQTFVFSGYAKGCGSDKNADSTLISSCSDLETIELKIKDTFYRTKSSPKGAGYQSDLSSVYFSVDNKYFADGSTLQKIKAEWYEYKTQPIVVVNNKPHFDALEKYIGVSLLENKADIPILATDPTTTVIMGASDIKSVGWGYNLSSLISSRTPPLTFLTNLFWSVNACKNDYVLTSGEIKEYLHTYALTKANYLPTGKDKKISADNFSAKVDEGATRGYNVKEIDSDDKFDLLTYKGSKWETFWDTVAFWNAKPDYGIEVPDISPIHQVLDSDFNSNIADKLLINKADIADFENYYNSAKSQKKTTILFRYALRDYYSNQLYELSTGNLFTTNLGHKGFMAQETCFFDFDIITLTFNKDGVYRVIPVVSNPIDVVHSVTAPQDNNNKPLWQRVLEIIVLVLLLILLCKVCGILLPILKFIWACIVCVLKIITYPFRKLLQSIKR